MDKEKEKEALTDCLINLAYYYLFAAGHLLYRFDGLFKFFGLDKQGKARMLANRAEKNVKDTIKILDSFDENFIAAAGKDTKKWDAYVSIANELIALNIAYLGHAYENPEYADKVFDFINSLGEENKMLDDMSKSYYQKSKAI